MLFASFETLIRPRGMASLAGIASAKTGRQASLFRRACGVIGRAATRSPVSAKAAAEVAMVRELARRHLKSDPGFAGDLLAAADRHETLYCNEEQQ